MRERRQQKIAIIGHGYVGRAMAAFFQEHYHLVVYDPCCQELPVRRNGDRHCQVTRSNRRLVNECDVALVCVPTPSRQDGGCDTSTVEEVVGWLKTPLIIIKSTVEPGTTDRLRTQTGKRLVFAPEYCGESSYWTPYAFHTSVVATPFFIFGGDAKDTSRCADLYLPVAGPTKVYRQTTALAAELAKYMENCFYATKIMFSYEMANLVAKAGADWNEVRDLWLLDPRLNPMHTAVFQDNDQPIGGKCLPKDLRALLRFGKKIGYTPGLLQTVLVLNDSIGKYRAERNHRYLQQRQNGKYEPVGSRPSLGLESQPQTRAAPRRRVKRGALHTLFRR
jgi:UDPglucose 6-dehydrogenase